MFTFEKRELHVYNPSSSLVPLPLNLELQDNTISQELVRYSTPHIVTRLWHSLTQISTNCILLNNLLEFISCCRNVYCPGTCSNTKTAQRTSMCLMIPHRAYLCRAASRPQLLLPSQHCQSEVVPEIYTFLWGSSMFPVMPCWYQAGQSQCSSAKAVAGCCGDGKRPHDENTGGRRWQQIQAREEQSSKQISHSVSDVDGAGTSCKAIKAFLHHKIPAALLSITTEFT